MAVEGSRKHAGPEERRALLGTWGTRVESNPPRPEGLEWAGVRSRMEARPGSLESLARMEGTGGEPDVVGQDEVTGEYLFYDCSAESPAGRRSVCYDAEALAARKKHRPADSAIAMAAAMGAALLTEEQYRGLQELGEFDTKTSSWLLTPPGIRKRGGAIFGDRRYGRVFVYHNGAESYYATRGFRCVLRV